MIYHPLLFLLAISVSAKYYNVQENKYAINPKSSASKPPGETNKPQFSCTIDGCTDNFPGSPTSTSTWTTWSTNPTYGTDISEISLPIPSASKSPGETNKPQFSCITDDCTDNFPDLPTSSSSWVYDPTSTRKIYPSVPYASTDCYNYKTVTYTETVTVILHEPTTPISSSTSSIYETTIWDSITSSTTGTTFTSQIWPSWAPSKVKSKTSSRPKPTDSKSGTKPKPSYSYGHYFSKVKEEYHQYKY